MNKIFYKIYHGNLAFSAIEEEALTEVIDKTYFALLELVEKNDLKVGLELSAYSLEKIQELRPSWIDKFKELHKKSLIELIGSGYMQIIAPLVPYEINIKNQAIGLEVYKNILGITPTIAYINEQVFSASMVNIYKEVGYSAIAMEWNNAYSINSKEIWKKEFAFQPVIAKGLNASLPILWTDTIVFQQFQRMAHKEISTPEYLKIISHHLNSGYKALPLYSSDLEIFNYRPGRFETEAIIHTDEWQTISSTMNRLKEFGDFYLPSEVIEKALDQSIKLNLTTVAHPILVKKQAKYSLSRWSACGRGANLINTLCYNYFLNMKDETNIKKLLQYWGSDYRTHTTLKKWNEAISFLSQDKKPIEPQYKDIENDLFLTEEDNKLIFKKENYQIIFNKAKGLAIDTIYKNEQKLAFGTVRHGDLDYITYGADFFTGALTIESSNTGKLTDLCQIEDYLFKKIDENIYMLSTTINIKKKATEYKSWIINLNKGKITLDTTLALTEFINGSIRAGSFTLLPQDKHSKLWYECKNGGKEYERFYINDDSNIEHNQAKSILQSSSGGIGVTNGVLKFGIGEKIIVSINIEQNISYPFVMLQNSIDHDKYLTRVFFSLQEIDDTLKVSQNKDFKLRYSINL